MSLDEVLELSPPPGASSAEIVDAIGRAHALRSRAAERARTAEATRTAGLLSVDDKTLTRARQEAQQAALTVERVDALLVELRTALAQATGRETVAQLRGEAAEVNRLMAELQDWQATGLPELQRAIGQAFQIQDRAAAAYSSFLANVSDAYHDEAVRDVGPLGVTVATLAGHLPRSLFMGWR